MPVSLTLSDLTWVTANGHRLFDRLNLHLDVSRVGLVGDNGAGKSTLLALIAGRYPPTEGRIRINGRPALLRQDLTGVDTVADALGVRKATDRLRRAQLGHAEPDEFADIDWALPERIATSLRRFSLTLSPSTPVSRLSGGQITRLSLAALDLAQPDLLLMDEPTNHLDAAGRQQVRSLLQRWRGGVLVASHDRELLDVMDSVVEIGPLGVRHYAGNGSVHRRAKAAERAAAEQRLHHAQGQVDRLAEQHQSVAERQAQRSRQGRLSRHHAGQPKMLLDAQAARSERTSAALSRIADRRQEQAQTQWAEAREQVARLLPLSLILPGTGLSAGQTVVRVESLYGGHDPEHDVIAGLDLFLQGPQRLRLIGDNGSGKSTLLALISGRLRPRKGHIQVIEDHVLLDQSLSLLDDEASVLQNFQRLNPDTTQTRARTLLSQLQFRGDDVHCPVSRLSGGQRMRVALACTIANDRPARLILLDEPTNHLDLTAQQELESALQSHDGAMILVSHDPDFVRAVGVDRELALPSAGQASAGCAGSDGQSPPE